MEDAHWNLTPGAVSHVDSVPEAVDDDEDWDFDGATGGESAQRVGMKRKEQNLQSECWTKNWKNLTNVTEIVLLVQKSLLLADGPVNTVPPSEFPVTTEGSSTGLGTELDKAKPRIVELESVETITFRRHKDLPNKK